MTVVIPAFQAAAFLEPALVSAAAQTHRDIEILVVDDGSTDDTTSIAEAFARRDDRLRVLRQENRGVSAARNHGIAEATGEFLALLDSDDEWLPNKLERQLREFARGARIAAVGCLMEYVSSHGKALGVSGETSRGRQRDIAGAQFMPFAGSALLVPTALVREVGGFDESLSQAEDLDLLSKLARHGTVITVPEVLGRYRIHAESASARDYFGQRTSMRYLGARMQAREQGNELDWDTFRQEFPTTPRDKLGDFVGYIYRTAGLRMADGRILSGAILLAFVSLLNPRYTLRRLMRQRGSTAYPS